MKKWLSLLLILCLCAPCALAGWEDEPFHSVASVTSYEGIKENYSDFYNAGEFSVTIPGLAEDFIPQGIAYYAPKDLIFFSGYSKIGMPCALMAVERSTNKIVKEIFLDFGSGEDQGDHAGGVCVTGKNIFISDHNRLYRMSLDTFFNADNSCVYNFEEIISVPCEASFCQYTYGILWVGEFERTTLNPSEKQYKTDPSHHIKIKGGENTGWILGYELTSSTENEFDPSRLSASGAIPNYILSIPERIQGFTISRDLIYLSQSYGRKNTSTIYRHRNVLNEAPHAQTTVYGMQVPMWILNDDTLTAKLTCPPMTEGLCTIEDRVFITFESGAAHYRIPLDDKGPAMHPVDRVFKLNKF